MVFQEGIEFHKGLKKVKKETRPKNIEGRVDVL
jgi:hypothetical protein